MRDLYPVTITRQQLIDVGACPEGVDAFDAHCPGGSLVVAGPEAQSALLATPLGAYESWTVDEGLLQPIVLMGGYDSTLTGGDRSTLTGGDYSKLMGGDHSALTGGDYSTLTGGDDSVLTGGNGSVLTGGDDSTLTGGDDSILSWRWWDGRRLRLTTIYVGEDGIEADVAYTCDRGVVQRAEVSDG